MSLREHDFELVTCFCVKCGAAMEDVVNSDRVCASGITAISHLVARRRMDALVGRVLNVLA